MLSNWLRLPLSLPIIVVIFATVSALDVDAASTIAGRVYDKQRNLLPDVDVELLNDYYQLINKARTDGSGKYEFSGLSNGRFTVRVMAFRYDFEDQEVMVEINSQNIRGGEGSTYMVQDFYMLPRKGGLADTEVGVVFAQDVPPEAKKSYERGIKEILDKRVSEGILSMNEALKQFPTYYLALHRIGRELFMMKKYSDSVPFLVKAVEVNPKSATSLYYLGYSFHNIGKEYDKASLRVLNQALVLAPSSVQVLYVLGKVERRAGKYADAEKHLLQAKKFTRVAVPEIHKELAQLYSDDLRRYKEAADELEQFLKASKQDGSESAQTKKVIAALREKAKVNPAN